MKPSKLLLVFALLIAACSGDPSPAASAPTDPDDDVPQAEDTPSDDDDDEVDAAADAPPPPPEPPADACDPLSPRTKALEVAVLPDAGATPFVNAIGNAKKQIRVMVYQMGYGPVLDGLLAKAKAGVKVRVILDVAQTDVNQKYKDQLEAAGADVIWSDIAFTYMHAKVLIVDDLEAVVSTGNYSIKYMLSERNYAVTDRDPSDVDVLVKMFDADFARTSPDLHCTRLLVSPVNAKDRLLAFIKSATRTLLVESMQFGDTDIQDAVLERKAAGVDVRVILADPAWIEANTKAGEVLVKAKIPVRHLADPGVHVKAIVVDGKTAYAGSINLSWTSLTKNREVGLLVSEPSNLAVMTSTFEKDWSAATAF